MDNESNQGSQKAVYEQPLLVDLLAQDASGKLSSSLNESLFDNAGPS